MKIKDYFTPSNTLAFLTMVFAFSIALAIINIGWLCAGKEYFLKNEVPELVDQINQRDMKIRELEAEIRMEQARTNIDERKLRPWASNDDISPEERVIIAEARLAELQMLREAFDRLAAKTTGKEYAELVKQNENMLMDYRIAELELRAARYSQKYAVMFNN